MTTAEQSAQIEAEFERERQMLDRRAQAEQARVRQWVEGQILPALDPSFDAAIAEARRALDAARADLTEARRALDDHAAARPTDRSEVAVWARRRTELLSEAEAFEGIYQDCQAVLAEAEDRRRVELLRIWSERGRHTEQALAELRTTWQERIAQAEQAVLDTKAHAAEELGTLQQQLNWLWHNRPA